MSMPPMRLTPNHRILVIDDNPSIHEDFRKILCPVQRTGGALEQHEAVLFGEVLQANQPTQFEIDSAFQGKDGLAMVQQALTQGRPYAMAFVDVRMPPGWDGIETITYLWDSYPELQVVICSAYSDYSWNEIEKALGRSHNMVILKKPFDNIEVLQLAHALTQKWLLSQQEKSKLHELDKMVQQRTQELQAANAKLQLEVEAHRQTETALRGSEERFQKAFRANPLAMAIQKLTDEEYVDVNDSFSRLTGLDKQAIIGHRPAELLPILDEPTRAKVREQLTANQAVHDLAGRIRTGTGALREVLLWAELFNLQSESFVLVIAQDITERLNLESQLRQAQKIEAVGQLAAGIAHDFNNVLTVIQGHVSLQLMCQKLDQGMRESAEEIGKASERAARLTRQLLAFSRRQVIQRQSLDLNQVILDLQNMLCRTLGEHITVVCDFAQDLPAVHADVGNVEQALTNFILNARDAMPEGGTLTLRTARVTMDAAYASRHPEARPGTYVCLSVIDTGCGMDAATRARVFEPFFTTKDVGKGTGMGLAMSHGILKQHGGWIEVESQVKQGSTFKLYLPITTENPGKAQTSVANPSGRQAGLPGRERILVVEDEAAVRALVRVVLEKDGYRLALASNGVEALKVWQEQRGDFDLLLTDRVMPEGISGRRLAQTLLAENERLKVIYSSGYNSEMVDHQGDLREGYNFLPKPYEPRKLLAAVRARLDQP